MACAPLASQGVEVHQGRGLKNAPVHKKSGIPWIVLLLLAAFLRGLPSGDWATVLAQSGSGWSEPVMVSTNTVKAWFPDIAVDGQGHAHIVWHSERSENGNSHDLLMYTTWDGETYSEPNDIVYPGVGGYTVRPVIAADGQGRLHVVYRDHKDVRYTQAPANAAWNAGSWAYPWFVSEGEAAYYSDIAIDRRGVIHVVWNEQTMDVGEGKTLWFGTAHGASRLTYDGVLPGDPQSWPGDYVVYGMLEGSDGFQWFATSTGLGYYDGVTWRWLTTRDGLASNQVRALIKDMDNTLWLGTDGGISHYEPQQSKERQWTTVPLPPELAPHTVQAMAVDWGGNVWVGTSGGLGEYSGQAWRVYHGEDDLVSENITAINADHADALWVGTDGGLMRYADGQWTRLTTRDGLIGNHVTALVAGADNTLWVGTQSGLTRYDGGTWQPFTSADGLIDNHVTALAIDSKGVLWVGTAAGVSRYDGSGWASYTVEDGLIEGHITAIAEDEALNAMCPACADIFYRRSEDGGQTWSMSVNLSSSYAGSVKPQVKTDESGGVHVTWEEGEDWYAGDGYPVGCVHRYSADGGTTWSEPFTFTHSDGPPQQITLGVGRNDELVAVWRLALPVPERSAVYYQRSTDQGVSWSEPQPISGILAKYWEPMSLDSWHAASDSAGHVHLLILGYFSLLDEEISLIYTVWDGQEWSQPYSLYTSADPPEWPRIAVGLGNQVHATWFTRDEAHIYDSEHGRYRVWAAQRQADAPPLAPAPTPVPVPTRTATPDVVLASTPTPMPAVPAGSTPPEGIFTDADDAIRLAIALSPVAGLVGAILIVRRFGGRLR
jgi:hypothetical protein